MTRAIAAVRSASDIEERLTALETRKARHTHDAMCARIAAELDIPVAEFMANVLHWQRRAAEIGFDAYLEEIAAAEGVTVPEMRVDMETFRLDADQHRGCVITASIAAVLSENSAVLTDPFQWIA